MDRVRARVFRKCTLNKNKCARPNEIRDAGSLGRAAKVYSLADRILIGGSLWLAGKLERELKHMCVESLVSHDDW